MTPVPWSEKDGPFGLCGRCSWVQVIRNRRGSFFLLCRKAQEDPNFSRYPSLPVLACPGYEEKAGGER